jgi:hypothetical protein
MPWIGDDLLKRITRRYEANADTLARQQAEQRLDDIEARLNARQQARGYRPATDEHGNIVRWVDCNPPAPREEFPR